MNPAHSLHALSWPPTAAVGPLALALLAAHLAGDFVFQTDRMARTKRNPGVLLVHAAIHAGVAYLAAACWALWWIPAAVFLSHAAIDYAKARAPRPTQTVFWVDQAAHSVVIAAVAIGAAAVGGVSAWARLVGPHWSAACVLVAGAIICVRVLAIVVGFWVQPYLDEIKAAGQDGFAAGASRGLTNGGRTIGQWERALIFLLVLFGQPAGIGFLIAAKSIFRFGELMDRRNRMEAEYITIGTLMSFGAAVAVAFITVALARRC